MVHHVSIITLMFYCLQTPHYRLNQAFPLIYVRFVFVCLTSGFVCEKPECTGISGPAGGAVLQV